MLIVWFEATAWFCTSEASNAPCVSLLEDDFLWSCALIAAFGLCVPHSAHSFVCAPTPPQWFLAKIHGTMASAVSVQAIHESLQDNGYARISGQEMKNILLSLCANPQDLEGFHKSWSLLGQDPVYPFRKTSQTRMLVSHSEIQRQRQEGPKSFRLCVMV